MGARSRFACGITAVALLGSRLLGAQASDRRQLERIEQTLRQEGQAIVALADALDAPAPADFTLGWHHDFLKAQTGTFVPFIVTIAPRARRRRPRCCTCARRARRPPPLNARSRRRPPAAGEGPILPPFEEIYPSRCPISRCGSPEGFPLPPGEYELTVVVREREREDDRGRRRLAAVLRRPLSVPDYSTGALSTSTIMLADRLTVLAEPPPAASLFERPYVIGTREIDPAADAVLRPSEELIVVFLVYNPAVTTDKQFDLEVEYHFFRRAEPARRIHGRRRPPV